MRFANRLLIAVGTLSILAGCGKPTPAGYWEGKASAKEIPLKDQFRTLTRSAETDFWFVVDWSPVNHTGVAVGEAEAVYDAELKVDNLPKVTAPVPGAASSLSRKSAANSPSWIGVENFRSSVCSRCKVTAERSCWKK